MYCVTNKIENTSTFSPLQVIDEPRDRETELAFILGSMDCMVANTSHRHKIFLPKLQNFELVEIRPGKLAQCSAHLTVRQQSTDKQCHF
jgi:hypothetical protein